MATSENYILQNPSQGSVYNLTIPTDSVVYVCYRQDSFPGIVFPFPTLTWNDMDYVNGRQDWENIGSYMTSTGLQTLYFCGKLKPDNTTNLVAFRLYTGCVPFTKSITVVANGYSRTGSGTVTRKIYEKENGERYMIDTCPDQTGTNSLVCMTGSGSGGLSNRTLSLTDNQVWRDSNGNIIGGSTTHFLYNITTQKVGSRIKQVANYNDVPDSYFGEHPTDGTQVGEETTVEVTDGIWEPATPITFTLNLNVVEKSYSYIYF